VLALAKVEVDLSTIPEGLHANNCSKFFLLRDVHPVDSAASFDHDGHSLLFFLSVSWHAHLALSVIFFALR
jgi:hypothetical protein